MKYAFPELRMMDIEAHVINDEIRMMNMDDRDRPLTMAIEGIGDIANKIWESIMKILSAIPKLCKKLVEKIKDSKLVASKNVNKADDLPASASSLSSDKLAKFKSYRAEIDSRRKKLMHAARDVIQTALNNCDALNTVIVPVFDTIEESHWYNLRNNTKFAANSDKIDSLYKDMETNSQALSKVRGQAESLQSYLAQFKNEVGNEKMFGEWVPNYSGDDNYESITNDLTSKSEKYKNEVEKLKKRFEKFFLKAKDWATGHDNNASNSAYGLLEKYQKNITQCNEICQTYSAVATVVYGVYTQGVSGNAQDVDKKSITSGSSGWVWNDSDKKNAHWDYKAMVRLKSGKKVTLTYAYNQEKNENQQPTRDIKQVQKDIIKDYNKSRANGDPAVEVIGEGGVAETKSDAANAANKIQAVMVKATDNISNFLKNANLEVIRKTLSDDDRQLFNKIYDENIKKGYEFKGYFNGKLAFVDKSGNKTSDSNMKDAETFKAEAKQLGYSDAQLSQLSAAVGNGTIRDRSSFDNWKNSHTPENKQSNNNNDQNNTQQNQQNQQVNPKEQKAAQRFKEDVIKKARKKGYNDQQVEVLTKMVDSGNISNNDQFNNWINKNPPQKSQPQNQNGESQSGAIPGYNPKLSYDDITHIYVKLNSDVHADKLDVETADRLAHNAKSGDLSINEIDAKIKEAEREFQLHGSQSSSKKQKKQFSSMYTDWMNDVKRANNEKGKGKWFAKRAKEAAMYFTEEQNDSVLEYMYDYGMSWDEAVEAVYADMLNEENEYIDAAIESLFEDDFDYEPSYSYEEDDEDKWDNFLT